MEDLRKDYNVKKKSVNVNLDLWWKSNKSYLYYFLSIILIPLVLFRPDIIGKSLGYWSSEVYSSFLSSNRITEDNWYVILITLLTISVCYFLIKKS